MLRLVLILFCIVGSVVAGFSQDSTLQILEMPLPQRPADYGTLDAEGSFVVRVQFLASGKIGEVTLITTLMPKLGDLAMAAARSIKFQPEIRDGSAVDSAIPVFYTYSWRHAGWKAHSTRLNVSTSEEAEVIVKKAIQRLGGERYLKVSSQVSRGKFSVMRDGVIVSFQSFIDVIVFPDKERTEFKGGKSKFVQTNVGSTGWTFDSDHELIKTQTDAQIENFHRGIRVSLDTLLRGGWRGKGKLEYIGKRSASLGKRNDVVRLKYDDGLTIDFEFDDDGTPMKASYKRTNADGEEITEEDRYAQWVDISGIRTPYIVDRFTNGKPSSRINYESLEYNVRVPDAIFDKPSNPKDLKKDLKL